MSICVLVFSLLFHFTDVYIISIFYLSFKLTFQVSVIKCSLSTLALQMLQNFMVSLCHDWFVTSFPLLILISLKRLYDYIIKDFPMTNYNLFWNSSQPSNYLMEFPFQDSESEFLGAGNSIISRNSPSWSLQLANLICSLHLYTTSNFHSVNIFFHQNFKNSLR